MNITDTMVLALLKKGLSYELENMKGKLECPIAAFSTGADASKIITVYYAVEKMSFKIEKD